MILESRWLHIRKITFFLGIGFLLLSGCSNDNNTPVNEDNDDNDYTPSTNDVVDEHGEITNLNILKKFVRNVGEGEQDKVRIVRYTTEGDPIILDLEFDTEKIAYTNDSTRDQYGDGEISTTTCKSISKNNTVNGTKYELSECENPDETFEILVVEQ